MFIDKIPNSIQIEGDLPLRGEVTIQGAKNAALPAIAGALLAKKGETVIRNVPHIQDVFISLEIAKSLGAKVFYDPSEQVIVINAENLTSTIIPSELSEKSRASILFLGALIGRQREAQLIGVGGCKIGTRKMDYHHRGFVRLGAQVEGDQQSNIFIQASNLKGNYLYLDLPSHTGTENLMMAACLAEGETIIDNAGSDPEIVDFALFLEKMGAKIRGVGSRRLYISGVKELNAVEHTLIPDRHDASAFAMAVAATKGTATLRKVNFDHQRLTQAKLEQMGVKFEYTSDSLTVIGPSKLCPINVIAVPYPGFPTDAQPGITALATLATGKSYVREGVFVYSGRFGYVEYLNSMGAEIIISQQNAIVVEGVEKLHGTQVVADDLRGGFAMIIAGVAAEGTTTISNFYQIARGHERVLERLAQLGAKVKEV